MGTIHLVRHGQAAFGTDDYDRLTALGKQQCVHLGAALAGRGVRLDAVFRGSLTRHRQTAEALIEGFMSQPGATLERAEAEIFPGLNEYDPHAVIKAYTGQAPTKEGWSDAREPDQVRQHFRVLRDALLAWAEGRTAPQGMPTFANFQRAASDVLAEARSRFHQGHVVVVTSGGPIGAMVAAALSSPARVAVELNLRVRNASLSEFATSQSREHLVMFNSVAHLEHRADLVTYA